jgi:chromosome segregation ATPase
MNLINPEVCEEKNKSINTRLDTHEKRLNNHADRLDEIEQFRARSETQITNLCDQIKSLVTTMRWFIGLMVGAFVGFFFYAVQAGLFK